MINVASLDQLKVRSTAAWQQLHTTAAVSQQSRCWSAVNTSASSCCFVPEQCTFSMFCWCSVLACSQALRCLLRAVVVGPACGTHLQQCTADGTAAAAVAADIGRQCSRSQVHLWVSCKGFSLVASFVYQHQRMQMAKPHNVWNKLLLSEPMRSCAHCLCASIHDHHHLCIHHTSLHTLPALSPLSSAHVLPFELCFPADHCGGRVCSRQARGGQLLCPRVLRMQVHAAQAAPDCTG